MPSLRHRRHRRDARPAIFIVGGLFIVVSALSTFFFLDATTGVLGLIGSLLLLTGIGLVILWAYREGLEDAAEQERDERYRILFQHSPDPIVVHAAGRIVDGNYAAVALLGGTSKDAFLGLPVMQFIHPDDQERVVQRIQEFYRTRRQPPRDEIKLIKPNGDVVEVEIVSMLVRYNQAPAIQVAMRDISRRKRAEEALRSHEAFLNSIFEHIPYKIFVKDAGDLRYVRFNRAGEQLLGYSR